MKLVVTQINDGVCVIWSGNTVLVKNVMGGVVPQNQGSRLVGRVTKKFCKQLFGSVPRPRTAKRFEVTYLGKVEIGKQK